MTQLRIDDILRPIGMLESQIKYLNDDYEELERIITQTSKAVAQATDGIGLRFFRPVGSIVWSN
jgi:prefoldin subunit 5